ncbi:sugar phosphate isomerase/epimerase family protein [Paenibacillus koleovorans]|uniref:sugar phosphate isomerase/epimerase family protein n=1 Tax=Paenibacillus koleovorans TaxID=121608 RepID=UPI000FD88213|nr:sugar phosphate isomerase/epimerase [Paenibacillus koleovorans]
MKLRGIGVSLMSCDAVSRLERLKEKLARVCEAGFDTVEIPITGLQIIRNGEIDAGRLDAYAELLQSFDLHYTLHAPFDLNLFRPDDPAFEKKLFLASLEATGALGGEVMVYHVGRYVGEEQFLFPHTWPLHTSLQKQQLLKEEEAFLRQAGDRAEQLNVDIGMENMRPYLECPDYCYSVLPGALAKQVAAIDHPRVGIALDVGHLYLSMGMYGLDLQQEMAAILPHVTHLHIHDNYGKPSFSTEKNQFELLPLGRGDMHMPIGEGLVPMETIAQQLVKSEREVYMIHEIREKYESDWVYLSETYKDLRSFVGKAAVFG